MAGLNPAGTANTGDYNIGRGKIYFASLDVDGIPQEYRFLGNAPEFNVTVETETQEHTASTTGLAVIDKEVTLSQKVTLNITLDEINFENLALFLSGATGSHDNSGATAGVTGSANLVVTEQGRWYDLYQSAGGAPSTDSHGDRIYDCGTITVSGSVLGTDFMTDQVMGRIFVMDGGNLTVGNHAVDIAANGSADTTVDEVQGLSTTSVAGALKFISENPASSDVATEYQFHQVALKAEGDLSLIGDDFTQLTLSGVAERNETADPNSPTVTIRTHANA